ncbi:hypothetical protein EV714DRAFT_237884 [Schizophyllum commune]
MPQSAPSLFTVLAQPSDYTVVVLLLKDAERRRTHALASDPVADAVGKLCEIELDLCTRLIEFYEAAVAHDEALCNKHRDLTGRALQLLDVADVADLKQAQDLVRQHLLEIFQSVLDFLGRELNDNDLSKDKLRAAVDVGDHPLVIKHAKATAAYAKFPTDSVGPQSRRKVTGIWQSIRADAKEEAKLKKDVSAGQDNRFAADDILNDQERPFGNVMSHSKRDGERTKDHLFQTYARQPQKVDIGAQKTDIGAKKTDIGAKKTDIGAKKIDINALWAIIADLRKRAAKASEDLAHYDLKFQHKLRADQKEKHRNLASHGHAYEDALRQIRRSTMLVAFQKGIDLPELSYDGSSPASADCSALLDKLSGAVQPPACIHPPKRCREEEGVFAGKPLKKRK